MPHLNLSALAQRLPARNATIKTLARIHNTTYHLISLLATDHGQHPKHGIQRYERYFLQHIRPTDRVIDIGCGTGHVANAVAGKAAHAVGIDISRQNIQLAEQRYQRANLEFILGDALAYEFMRPFDVIILSNVLEHIENRVKFLSALKRVAPRLLIRVPMLTRDWLTVYKKNLGVEYRLDSTHFIEYTEEAMRQELTAAGWKIEKMSIMFGELYVTAARD